MLRCPLAGTPSSNCRRYTQTRHRIAVGAASQYALGTANVSFSAPTNQGLSIQDLEVSLPTHPTQYQKDRYSPRRLALIRVETLRDRYSLGRLLAERFALQAAQVERSASDMPLDHVITALPEVNKIERGCNIVLQQLVFVPVSHSG
jgi:hypothetical protein